MVRRDNSIDNDSLFLGSDYQSGQYTVVFAAGEMEKSFDIPVYEDIIQGEEETFSITITSRSHVRPKRVNIGRLSTATVNIVDTTGELTCNE